MEQHSCIATTSRLHGYAQGISLTGANIHYACLMIYCYAALGNTKG